MTVSSTSSVELSIDVICRRAMQQCGLLEPSQGTADPSWTSRSGMARDFLEIDIEACQGEGILVRAVDFYSVTLVAGTSSYSLPSTTLDVFGPGMLTLTGQTSATLVELIDRDEWHRITDKTITGRPTRYYPDRVQTIALKVHPVPTSADVGTLVVQRHKALATSRDGSTTVDFERHWTDYFVWKLAYRLALSAGVTLATCQEYLRNADKSKDAAAKQSQKQRAPTAFENDHGTGWQ